MKTTKSIKMRTKLASALMASIVATAGLVSTTLSASAEESTALSIEEQIFEVCQYQCIVSGVPLTSDEEQELMITINKTIHNYALENDCGYDEAGEMILTEMMIESGLDSLPRNMVSPCSGSNDSGGLEDITYIVAQLPTSSKGNIFYADNEWAWNHVGMYTTTKTIIESKPKTGVQEVSIYSEAGQQHRTLDVTNDSCILRVRFATIDQKNGAVSWAQQYVGKKYNGTFISNRASDNSSFNCSELVWKAYMYGVDSSNNAINIDLDSNGGLAVYPNNIKNSDQVSEVSKW